MSQQKIIFTVCAAAALVALVSGQSMNPTACSDKAQSLMQTYMKNTQKQVMELASSMGSQATSSFNPDQLSADMNAMAEQAMNMIPNTSSGIDMSALMSSGTQLMQQQMSLMMKYANPTSSLSSVQSFMKLQSSMMQSNMELISNIASACMPGSSL